MNNQLSQEIVNLPQENVDFQQENVDLQQEINDLRQENDELLREQAVCQEIFGSPGEDAESWNSQKVAVINADNIMKYLEDMYPENLLDWPVLLQSIIDFHVIAGHEEVIARHTGQRLLMAATDLS